MPLLRLIRLPNLVVVVLTQALVFYRVIRPALQRADIPTALSDWRLFELIVATCMVTAAGYIINDIFDKDIDAINDAGRHPLAQLPHDFAVWLYCCFTLGGFILSTLIALRLNELEWLWLYPVAVLLLALYSPLLKRQPLVGNLLIAAYCAGVAGIVWLAERKGLAQLNAVQPLVARELRHILAIFMLFAFGSTLLREIIKDLEDLKGDHQHGRRTLPVLLGISTTRWIGLLLGFALLGVMLWPIIRGWAAFDHRPLLYGLIALVVWLLGLLFGLLRARIPADFHRLSLQLKFFMLGGIILLLLFQASN